MSFLDILAGIVETYHGFRWSYAGDLADGVIEPTLRKTQCKLCGDYIPKGSYRFVAQEFNAKIFRNVKKYYHVRCAQILILFEANRLNKQFDRLTIIAGTDIKITKSVRQLLERKLNE